MKKTLKTLFNEWKKAFTTISLIAFYFVTLNAQTVYVDEQIGNDSNPGTQQLPLKTLNKASEVLKSADNDVFTIKVNPGLYVLDKTILVETNKNPGQGIVIESTILPGDSAWNPEKMPVIISTAKKDDLIPESNFIVGFLVKESNHKGIKVFR